MPRWKMQSDTHRRYNAAVCFIMNVFDPRVPCKHRCRWIAPYGYVRNASCPKHDWSLDLHSVLCGPEPACALSFPGRQLPAREAHPAQTGHIDRCLNQLARRCTRSGRVRRAAETYSPGMTDNRFAGGFVVLDIQPG